jgi:MFS family permease
MHLSRKRRWTLSGGRLTGTWCQCYLSACSCLDGTRSCKSQDIVQIPRTCIFLLLTRVYLPLSALEPRLYTDSKQISASRDISTAGSVQLCILVRRTLYAFVREYLIFLSVLSAFLIAIFPTLWLLQRLPTGKYLAANIFLWGVVEMCHAACTNPASILVCRFLLGLFQCCDLPAMIIIATMWWTKEEQPVRNAMICAVTSSIGNGLISFAFGHLEHPTLPKWKYIFLAVGGFTVLYGALMFFILPNGPAEAFFLSEREKVVAIERLRGEKLGIENKNWKWEQSWEAVVDWKNWILWIFFIAVNIPNGGLISFSTIIIDSLGFSSEDSSLMTIPTGIQRPPPPENNRNYRFIINGLMSRCCFYPFRHLLQLASWEDNKVQILSDYGESDYAIDRNNSSIW